MQTRIDTTRQAWLDVTTLVADPLNPIIHSQTQIDALKADLEEFGQQAPIRIRDKDGTPMIVAGHGLTLAIQQLAKHNLKKWGMAWVLFVPHDWSEEKARGFMVADNHIADLRQTDNHTLLEVIDQYTSVGYDLHSIGFDQNSYTELLESVAQVAPIEIDTSEDVVPVAAPKRCQRGDLWKLGEHYLLVDDCTQPENATRLMQGKKAVLLACDPPYNVNVDYGKNSDDAKSSAAYEAFSTTWFTLWQKQSELQVVTPGFINLVTWCRLFRPCHFGSWLKTNSMTHSTVSYFACWEPLLFFGAGWKRARASDVFDFPVGTQKETGNHPCPKPLKMWIDLLENYTSKGDIVLDVFGGSGTTLIAAERTGRRAYLCEIEPLYADIIVARYEKETGGQARRVA